MNRMTMPHALVATVATMALAGTGGAQPAPAAPQEAPTVEVTDDELESFVEARTAIGEIRQDYSERIAEAEGPDEAIELQQEANDKIVEAVEKSGLEVETFDAIAQAVRSDPALEQRAQEFR